MENTPQEAVLKTLPLVDIPEKNIRIRYTIIIYTNLMLYWEHILDTGFRVQILVPYRVHIMCGPLRTLIGPRSCFA